MQIRSNTNTHVGNQRLWNLQRWNFFLTCNKEHEWPIICSAAMIWWGQAHTWKPHSPSDFALSNQTLDLNRKCLTIFCPLTRRKVPVKLVCDNDFLEAYLFLLKLTFLPAADSELQYKRYLHNSVPIFHSVQVHQMRHRMSLLTGLWYLSCTGSYLLYLIFYFLY